MPPVAKEFYAKNRAEWREWLAQNHKSERAVWLIYDKGESRTLYYEDIVKEALCFGWVDSVPGKVSRTQAKLYISKRKPKSAWSSANKGRIEELTSSGLMTESGLRAVEIAKQDGSWDTLNRSDALEMPQELTQLLLANPLAKRFYEQMSPSSQKIILEWIYAAKTEETKLNRIGETVELARRGIKAHHYRQ